MAENEIIAMLGDIRSKMFDILSGEELRNVLSVIDEKMDKYRGVSDKEIGQIIWINQQDMKKHRC